MKNDIEELVREFEKRYVRGHAPISNSHHDVIEAESWIEADVEDFTDWFKHALTRLAEKTREEGKEDALHFMDATIRADEIRADERHRISVEVEKARWTNGCNCNNECYPDKFNAALTRVQEIINPKQNDV